MKLSNKKKKKMYFTAGFIVAILLIVLALLIAFDPIQNSVSKKGKTKTQEKIEIVEIQKPRNQDTTRQQAIEATIEQFKRLGEEVSEQNLQIKTIMKDDKQYYQIKSPQNTIWIDIKSGEIVRINSVSL